MGRHKKEVLFLECVPKGSEKKEGQAIKRFAELMEKNIEVIEIKKAEDFFKSLENNNHDYIHISCHGYEDDSNGQQYIGLPYGSIHPQDFKGKKGLKDRFIFLSGCSLGKENFVDPFWKITQPKMLIAPQRDIEFIDAAAFWIVLYYNRFYQKETLNKSFKIAKKMINNRGAMERYYRSGHGKE